MTMIGIKVRPYGKTITAGTEFSITTGEYSSWQIVCQAIALRDFTMRDVMTGFLERYPEQADNWTFNDSALILYMTELGLIQEVELRHLELHLGDYSDCTKVSSELCIIGEHAAAWAERERIVEQEDADLDDQDYCTVVQFLDSEDQHTGVIDSEPLDLVTELRKLGSGRTLPGGRGGTAP